MTASVAQVAALADLLQSAQREMQTIDPPTELLAGLDVDDAYRIQQEVRRRTQLAGATLIGRKIGLTSKAMQRQLGVNEPDYGGLFDAMQVASGGTAPAWMMQPRVEAELAFVLARSVSSDADISEVLDATHSIRPAIEIIDSRISEWRLTLADTIADNASAGAFVLGPPQPVPPDLAAVKVQLFRGDDQVAAGEGHDVLGHPAECVAWLARALARHGETLQAGDVVLSGAMHVAIPAAPGDTFHAAFSGLDEVSVGFRPARSGSQS